MPYRARAAEILAQWREVDRHLALLDPSPEADALVAELERLHSEYLRVVREAAQAHAELPPPFPTFSEDGELP